MQFSKTELDVVSQIGDGNKTIAGIAKALKMSSSQAYRVAKKLSGKGILNMKKGVLHPEPKTHVSLLMNIMSYAPKLAVPLSGTGLNIYTSLLEPKTVKDVGSETGFHKTTVLKKINQGRRMSLLILDNKKYRVNEKIWQNVRDYLMEMRRFDECVDSRVPVNSVIYFKNDKEILFSSKEDIDAETTAFSAYAKYGIMILGITNYYYLPKKRLSRKDVFMHSLYAAEKENDIRILIFVALFMAKYRKELSGIQHPIVRNLAKVFAGENIPGYPALDEIRDRAKVYGIKV